jgi:K+-transporting ATPase KdpF subunit
VNAGDWVGVVISTLLLVYLFAALIFPERF